MTGTRALLSPEARLVLLPPDPAVRSDEVRALLEGPVDWDRVLHFADRERAALPLWRAIRDAGAEVPSDRGNVLKGMAQIWEFKLLHLERLLLHTLDALREADIPVVLLKGAAAAVSVYDGFDRRPMIDADLLIRQRDARHAWELARTIGWRWQPDAFPSESYEDAHHLPPLQDEFGSGTGLEVHCGLLMPDHPFRFGAGDIRDHARTVRTERGAFRVPSASHQLLHCCIHFAWSHRFNSHAWRSFSDVDALVRSGQLDWGEFITEARRSHAETCCYWTLRLSGAIVGVAAPPDVLAELRPRGSEFLFRRLERHFALNLLPGDNQCPSVALKDLLWRRAIRRGGGSGGIDLPATPRPKTISERIPHHARSLRTWARYLLRVA